MPDLHIEIPAAVSMRVQQQRRVPEVYLSLLAQLLGRPPLSLLGQSEIVYDAEDEPIERIERFGDSTYGAEMRATPIVSGMGVHGEAGTWDFFGLPPGLWLRGYHYLDLRGSRYNEIRLSYTCDDALAVQIQNLFRQATHLAVSPP